MVGNPLTNGTDSRYRGSSAEFMQQRLQVPSILGQDT